MFGGAVLAQDLTPRAYWPAPHGTKALVVGYAYQTGDVVTDPSLPLTGVDSKIHAVAVAYQQTLSLFGRTSNLQFEIPYVDGVTTGLVFDTAGRSEPGRREVSGIGDFGVTWSINLLGAPTMDAAAFQQLRAKPRPVVGASIKVVAPTGEYEADKLINIGTNRWAVRAKLGYIQPLAPRLLLELAVGVWFFEDNDEFLGTTRKQDPITAIDFSLIRRFRPGFWGSLDANYYLGGRTYVDGVGSANFQRNSRAGLTMAFPLKPGHGIKVSFNAGVATKSGGDFNKLSLSYLYLFN